MVMILGWLSADAERASFSKRRNRSLFAENAAGMILIATLRSSRLSRARYTSHIPASAQWGDDLIRSELRAGGEQHSARHYIPQQGLGVDLRLSRADLPPRQARNDVPTGLGEIASPFSPKRLCYPLGAFSPRFSKWHAITGVTLRPSCSAVSCGCYATQRAADVPGPSNAANVSHSAG